jgi:hypothetical protein
MKEWERHIKDLLGRLYRSVICQLALEQNIIQDRELKADVMISLEKENNHSYDAMRCLQLDKFRLFVCCSCCSYSFLIDMLVEIPRSSDVVALTSA